MGNFVEISTEIDLLDYIHQLDASELIQALVDVGGGNFNAEKMSLLQEQNIEDVIRKIDKINQFELEDFLNKY